MAAAEYKEQEATITHELLHGLGLASSSWALFRQTDGTPRTARGSDGWPVVTSNYACPDGSVGNVWVPSTNTLTIGSSNGEPVVTLVTPRVAAVAKDMFECGTVTGARLENQPTASGACWPSHWEQRDHMGEVMVAVSAHAAALSPLSLAVLEDSGENNINTSQVRIT